MKLKPTTTGELIQAQACFSLKPCNEAIEILEGLNLDHKTETIAQCLAASNAFKRLANTYPFPLNLNNLKVVSTVLVLAAEGVQLYEALTDLSLGRRLNDSELQTLEGVYTAQATLNNAITSTGDNTNGN